MVALGRGQRPAEAHPLAVRAKASARRRAGIGLVLLAAGALALPTSSLAAPGDLDRGFSRNGKLIADFGGKVERAEEVAAVPGGGFVAIGTSSEGPLFSSPSRIVVARRVNSPTQPWVARRRPSRCSFTT